MSYIHIFRESKFIKFADYSRTMMSLKFHTIPAGHPDPLALSAALLTAVRTGEPMDEVVNQLARLPFTLLVESLHEDAGRKAFWINLYNSFNLIQLRTHPVDSKQDKARHFFGRGIVIAGVSLSLNDIEHRILRRSKRWWGRGRYARWWPSSWERALRVDTLDPRVHFALNCGAVSCPPIRFYTAEEIDAQLDLATTGYLATDLEVGGEGKLIVSGLFRMYEFDFGGPAGVRAFILRYRPELMVCNTLVYKQFDGTRLLDHFADAAS